MDRRTGGPYETEPLRGVARGPLGGNPKHLRETHERVGFSLRRCAGLPGVRRTGCDCLCPQLVARELMQVSLHEATGLDGFERHWGIESTATCRGSRGQETEELRRESLEAGTQLLHGNQTIELFPVEISLFPCGTTEM